MRLRSSVIVLPDLSATYMSLSWTRILARYSLSPKSLRRGYSKRPFTLSNGCVRPESYLLGHGYGPFQVSHGSSLWPFTVCC